MDPSRLDRWCNRGETPEKCSRNPTRKLSTLVFFNEWVLVDDGSAPGDHEERSPGQRTPATVQRAETRTKPRRSCSQITHAHGYNTLKILIRVWNSLDNRAGSTGRDHGTIIGKHGNFHSFGPVTRHYTPEARAQLLAMSPATIDRMLKPAKAAMNPPDKSSITSHRTRFSELILVLTQIPMLDEQPGFVTVDTVAHCGHTLRGQFAYMLTVTDVFTGWTVNRDIKTRHPNESLRHSIGSTPSSRFISTMSPATTTVNSSTRASTNGPCSTGWFVPTHVPGIRTTTAGPSSKTGISSGAVLFATATTPRRNSNC